jgi:uncharacterized protein HemX
MIGPKTILAFVVALLLAAGGGFFYGKHVDSAERDADLLQDATTAHEMYVEETKRGQALGKKLTEKEHELEQLRTKSEERFAGAGGTVAAGSCVSDEQLRVLRDVFLGPTGDGTK